MKKKTSPSTRVTRSRLGAFPRHAPYTTSTPIPESTFDPTWPITGENVPSQQRTIIIDPTFVMLSAPLPPLPTSEGEEEDGMGQEEGATCLGYATPPSGRVYLTKEKEELKREEKYLIEAEKHVQQLRQTFELHSARTKERLPSYMSSRKSMQQMLVTAIFGEGGQRIVEIVNPTSTGAPFHHTQHSSDAAAETMSFCSKGGSVTTNPQENLPLFYRNKILMVCSSRQSHRKPGIKGIHVNAQLFGRVEKKLRNSRRSVLLKYKYQSTNKNIRKPMASEEAMPAKPTKSSPQNLSSRRQTFLASAKVQYKRYLQAMLIRPEVRLTAVTKSARMLWDPGISK